MRDRPESIARHARWIVAAVAVLWACGASAAPGTVSVTQPVYTASVSVDRGERDFIFPREAVAPQATIPERKKPLAAKTNTFDNPAASFAAVDDRLTFLRTAANSPCSSSRLPAARPGIAQPRAPPPAR